jgi:hypothetical protein
MKIDDFRHRRAKPGQAQRRKELLSELRITETCVFHSTILCSGEHPLPEWVANKAKFEAEVKALVLELDQICQPEDPRAVERDRARREKGYDPTV